MLNIKKYKYCCSWFSILHQQPDTSNCIRVIKFTRYPSLSLAINSATGDTGKDRFIKDSKVPYRFF